MHVSQRTPLGMAARSDVVNFKNESDVGFDYFSFGGRLAGELVN